MASLLSPDPRPVTILGGFLGAGKTTLLSHVLKNAQGVRVGVLVNDFGEVNIDAELIAEVAGGITRLTNGCMCCTIRSDVSSALFQLIESHPLDHVMIESSGLADPHAVAESFLQLHKQGLIRLDGLVSVVDAENFPRTRAEQPRLAEAQVRAADLLVLSKTDLAGPEKTERVEAELRALSPRARVMRVIEGRAPLEALLGLEPELAKHEHTHDHEHDDHAQTFATWTFREDRPFAWKELAPVLAKLPSAVFRVKGFLHLVERPGDRILLHVVGGRVHVRTIEPWSGAPQNLLVMIGARAHFDAASIEAQLRACAR